MIGEQVEIYYQDNFYDGMVGTVLGETEHVVLVEIKFAGISPHKVTFYKFQVVPYEEEVI